jgi:hypothetical protein
MKRLLDAQLIKGYVFHRNTSSIQKRADRRSIKFVSCAQRRFPWTSICLVVFLRFAELHVIVLFCKQR